MKLVKKIFVIGFMPIVVLFSSCDKFFDVSTDDILLVEDKYSENSVVYAGLMGLASTFRETVEHNIILSELLGDMMTPTDNAPSEAWDVFRFKSTNGNSYADPAPYYKLILNSNDFIKNVIEYNNKYPGTLPTNVYKGMLSTALCYRAWSYLQLGKLYGKAIYYDALLTDNNGYVPSKELSLDELVEELIYNMKTGVDGVNAFQTLNWKTIVMPLADDSDFDEIWNRSGVDANVLLTELYLWAGDYTNAAKTGINYASLLDGYYKLTVFSGSNFNNMFVRSYASSEKIKEGFTILQYDFEKNQTSKLNYYFSNESPNVYYFAPTFNGNRKFASRMLYRTLNQNGAMSTVYSGADAARSSASIGVNNGFSIIKKYQKKNETSYKNESSVYVYRAGELYLMIAEALSGLGGDNIAAADSIINVGFTKSWKTDHFERPFEAPIYGKNLSKCVGLRRRAGVKADYVRYHVDSVRYPGVTDAEKVLKEAREKYVLDSLICEETSVELAYEGKRWFTLLRIARNTNKPELLAKQIAMKFSSVSSADGEIYERWLMDPKNWFIKWDQTHVLNVDNE